MWKNWNFETKSGILDLMEHMLSSKKHIFTQIFIFSTFLVSKSTSPSIWKHFLKQSHVNNYHIMWRHYHWIPCLENISSYFKGPSACPVNQTVLGEMMSHAAKKDFYLFDNRYGIEIIELEEIDILIFGTIRISELQKSAPTF